MNLAEHLSKEQYRQLLKVAAREGCNYFTYNIPNTICNECGHIDKRYLKECPICHSHDVDYLTRVIGYMSGNMVKCTLPSIRWPHITDAE
jgi:Oxygen-sensitive ribonucleoside-triphosphate reductase